MSSILLSNETHKIFNKSCKLNILKSIFIVYRNGIIKRKMKSGKWKVIKNNINHNHGYNVIMINKQQFTRSQIIAHAFMNYNILNKDSIKNTMVIYKDKNRMNCDAGNLMIRSKNYYLCA